MGCVTAFGRCEEPAFGVADRKPPWESSNHTPDRNNVRLAADFADNSSCWQQPHDAQLEASPHLPGLASPLDSRVVKREVTQREDSAGESATVMFAVLKQEPLSPQEPEVEDVSFWDASRIKQEATECKDSNSVEHCVAPREVPNEEVIRPQLPDSVDLFGLRIKEEVMDFEDNSELREHCLVSNQEGLVPEEPEAASLLGAPWIKQEATDDNLVEHCAVSSGWNRQEEPWIKQEPAECDDNSNEASSVVPLLVPKQEPPSPEQPELAGNPAYFLDGCKAAIGVTQENCLQHSVLGGDTMISQEYSAVAVKEEPTSPSP